MEEKTREMICQFMVSEEDADTRIDKYLAGCMDQLSRSYLQKLLKSGQVLANGKPIKSSYRVSEGEMISRGGRAGDPGGAYTLGYSIRG